MKPFLLSIILMLSFRTATAHAQEEGPDWFVLPSVGVGYNSVQGTALRIGLDLGVRIDSGWFGGVGAYYEAGNHPDADRELGAGPFIGYIYPVVRWLSVQAREDVEYVDQRDPILVSGSSDTYTYDQQKGIVSQTYGGVHLAFSSVFGVSVGYRGIVGISKSSLADGRSGFVYGLTIGI
jgi:hypothetical protein